MIVAVPLKSFLMITSERKQKCTHLLAIKTVLLIENGGKAYFSLQVSFNLKVCN